MPQKYKMIHLRLLRPSDASPAWLAWLRSPEVGKWIRTKPTTVAGLRELIRTWQADRHSSSWAYGIFVGSRHIGNLKLARSLLTKSGVEVGILIGPADCRGKGYGTLALHEAVKKAKSLGFKWIIAGIDAENHASRKSFKKAGFFETPRSVWAVRGTG